MIMLTGIKAFEARWQFLKKSYPTTATDNNLLMQSMGRLVDNYATQTEIARELPTPLQALFNQLVDAYLNGYWVEETKVPQPKISPALLAAQQHRQQRQSLQPTASSEAGTYIIGDRNTRPATNPNATSDRLTSAA